MHDYTHAPGLPDIRFARPAGFVESQEERAVALRAHGIFHQSFRVGEGIDVFTADESSLADVQPTAWLTGALLESGSPEPGQVADLLYRSYQPGAADQKFAERRDLPCGPAVVVARRLDVSGPESGGSPPATEILQIEAFIPLPGCSYMIGLSISTTEFSEAAEMAELLDGVLESLRISSEAR